MEPKNSPKEVSLRRNEYNLIFSGMAVIAFGVWSVLRMLIYYILQKVDLLVEFSQDESLIKAIDSLGREAHIFTNWVLLLILVLILSLDVLLRVYIGRSAMADARGIRKKTIVYIVIAAVMTVLQAMSYIDSIFHTYSEDLSQEVVNGMQTSGFVELTNIIAFCLLVYSAYRVRTLRKDLGIVIQNPRRGRKKKEV